MNKPRQYQTCSSANNTTHQKQSVLSQETSQHAILMDSGSQNNTKPKPPRKSRSKKSGPALTQSQNVDQKLEGKKETVPQSQATPATENEMSRLSSKKPKSNRSRSFRSCEKTSFIADDFKYPQPKPKDFNIAENVTKSAITAIGLNELKPPVLHQSLLDTHSNPVLPFYNKISGLKLSYPLSSKAPFASNDKFAFIGIENENDRVLYAHRQDLLYNTFKRQARQVFSTKLARTVLKHDGHDQFGMKFLSKSQLVGGVFEKMQLWCASHFKFSNVDGNKTSKKPKQALMEPILNPSHRNLIDEEEGGADFIDEAELDSILSELKDNNQPQFKKAFEENIKYREYSTQCFEDIQQEVSKSGNLDFNTIEKLIQEVLNRHSLKLDSSSLHNTETDKAFEVKKGIQMCKYPAFCQNFEPATSINAFEPVSSAEHFVIQHTNVSQLFQQQLLRNPIGMYYNPHHVLISLTGGPQIDGKFFINHTNKFIGSYEGVNDKNEDSDYKIESLKATVSLNGIIQISNKLIDTNLQGINRTLSSGSKNGTPNKDAVFGCWKQFETQVIGYLKQFFETARSKVSQAKLEYFKKCNPLMYVQFKIDGKYQGFWINIHYNFDGDNKERLYFRIPDKRPLFDKKDMEEVRQLHINPTLVHVAKLADQRRAEEIVSKINWDNQYDLLEKFFGRNLYDKDDKLSIKPWYLLFRLYKQNVLVDSKVSFENVELHNLGIYIQVAKKSMQPHELIAEYMLSNVGSSDYGNHTGIDNKQGAILLKWVYQSFLMTSEVEVGKLFVESPKRVNNSHINNLCEWKKDSREALGQNTISKMFSAIPKDEIPNFVQFMNDVADVLRSDQRMNLSQVVFSKAYEHYIYRDKPEVRKVTMLVLNYFENSRGQTESQTFIKELQEALAVTTYWRIIPFNYLIGKLKHEHKHHGLMSSKYILTQSAEEFDNYLDQIQYPMSRDQALISFDEDLISLSNQQKFEEEFNVLLTRILVWYVQMTGYADYDQTSEIISHTNTRLNFSVLIGCSFYRSNDNCTLEDENLLALIQKGQSMGPLPSTSEAACLEYCGYILKKKLVDYAENQVIKFTEWPKQLFQFVKQKKGLKERFRESKSNGFGPIEDKYLSSEGQNDQELQQNQTSVRNRDAKALVKRIQLDKKLLQQYQQTPANMTSVVEQNYLKYQETSQKEFRFCFTAPTKEFNPEAGLKNYVMKFEKAYSQTESESD